MSTEKIPKSLFSCCLELVAANLDIVEHFLGFPSLIGETIFRAAEVSTRWSDHSYVTTTLKLFTEAFEDEVLSAVNLSGQYLGLNYYLQDLLMFRHVVQLDISSCGLGDDHELLAQITQLERLEELSLRNDCLSDAGIQKMTAPYRMFQRGPAVLHILDISGNIDITVKCLKYLTPFPTLKTVFLPSGQNTQKESVNGWCFSCGPQDKFPDVPTVGWASNLVQSWMEAAGEKAHQIRKKKINFYSNSRKEQALRQPSSNVDSAMPSTVVATRLCTSKDQNMQHRNILNSENVVEDGGFYCSVLKENTSHRNVTGYGVRKRENGSMYGKAVTTSDAVQSDSDKELLNIYSNESIGMAGESLSLNLDVLDRYQPVKSQVCENTATAKLQRQHTYQPKGHGIVMPASRKRKRALCDVNNASRQHTSVNLYPSTACYRAIHQKEMLPLSTSAKTTKKNTGISKDSLHSCVTAMDSEGQHNCMKRAKLPPAKKIKLLKSVKTTTAEKANSVNVPADTDTTTVASKSCFLDALDSY